MPNSSMNYSGDGSSAVFYCSGSSCHLILLTMSDIYWYGLFFGLRNGIIFLIVSVLWNTDRPLRISTD